MHVTTPEHGENLSPHEHARGEQMKSLQYLGQSFMITCQSAKPAHPAEIPLDHPPPGQQVEPSLGREQLDDDTWFRRASFSDADQFSQFGDDGIEDARGQPVAGLLVDRWPRGQIVGHGTPLQTGACHQAQSVEQFPQRIRSL